MIDIKERNRKIRISDSSKGGWLTVKHYESNAVALDLEDDKRIRAAEREALRAKNRTRAKRHNAERVQGPYLPFSKLYNLRGQSQPSQFASSAVSMQVVTATPRFLQSPTRCLPVLWIFQTLEERVSRQASPNLHHRKRYSRCSFKS